MTHADLTPEGDCLPTFVEGSEALPLPIFVTRQTDRSSKKAIWEKIAKSTQEQQTVNGKITAPATDLDH